MVGLVLLSALLHAVWNVMLKATADREAAAFLFALGSAALAWTWVGLFEGVEGLRGPAVFRALAAGLFEAAYWIALTRCYRVGPVAPAYAVARGMAPVLLLPPAVVFMAEPWTPSAVAAMAVIAAGVLILGFRDGAGVAGQHRGLYFFLALLTAFFIAGYNGCYKLAREAGLGAAASFGISTTFSLPFQWIALARTPRRSAQQLPVSRRLWTGLRSHPLLIPVGSLFCFASFVLYLVALKGGPAAQFASLRNLSIPLASWIARWTLREKLASHDWLGLGVITAGVVALSYLAQG